jgi:hypothetical protein
VFRFLLKVFPGIVAIILLFTSEAAHAEMANGSYLFDFSGIVALWDLSGFYSGGIGPFSIGLSITANSSGELTGSGGFDLEGLGGDITSVSGSLMGSSTDPHVAMKLKMSGKGNLEGINAKVTLSGNMHYQLNSADKGLEHPSGSGTITIRDLSNGKSRSESGSFKRSALTALALPTNSTGGWLLFLNLTPDRKGYTGTASIELSTGSTIDFTAAGTYDSGTDTSKVELVGDAGKLKLVISTSGAILNVESAKGKIFGQKINYQLDPSSTPTPTPVPTATPTPIACPNPGTECTAGPVTVTSLAPSSAVFHGPDLPLSVCGCNFTSSSTIEWNGKPLATTFTSANQLNATIPATDTFAIGVENVTVSDNMQTSAPQTFFVGETGGDGFAEVEIDQPAQGIVYDPVNHAIYLSLPRFGSIAVIRFPSASITSSIPAGSGPDALAISDDSSYLYAGIDGAGLVQRFTLPSLARDISYSLGSSGAEGLYFPLDLQVAPGAPHTTAVSLGLKGIGPSASGGVEIFDDSTARPRIAPGFGAGVSIYDSLQWGTDDTMLYAANSEDTAFDFYTLAVNAMGVSLIHDYPNLFDSFNNRIHFDKSTGLLYADDGQVIDPSGGSVVGTFPRSAAGAMVPDSTLNKAFFAEGNGTIESFNLNELSHISSITVPNFPTFPFRVIRWGNNGLAILDGPLYLIGGNFVP